MTAEIAVMNKSAIALAADSASTVTGPNGLKTFNTANKIFRLCDQQAVGIMVYGNSEIMEMPWETMVKTFRTRVHTRDREELREIAEDFLDFVRKWTADFPKPQKERYVSFSSRRLLFTKINANLDPKELSPAERGKKVEELADKHLRELTELKVLDGFPDDYPSKISRKYGREIEWAVEESISQGEYEIPEKVKKQLKRFCLEQFHRDYFHLYSGVVIAGFGSEEVFPAVVCYEIDGLALNGHLKHRTLCKEYADFENAAVVSPFAQTEMVKTFVHGIDPNFDIVIKRVVSGMLDQLEKALSSAFGSEQEKEAFRKFYKKNSADAYEAFEDVMEDYMRDTHEQPLITAVASLPKAELATLAESLVNITALKRRVSTEADTVGGATDVAVISKGDGFIWIKQKHYFSLNFNPRLAGNPTLHSQSSNHP